MSILICVSFLPLKVEAALLGWDLVDSGKHLDWDSNSKYISIINRSVGIWEGYRQGVVRRDSWNKWQDVFISDYNEVSNTLGVTSPRGTMKLNDYNFKSMSKDKRTKTVTHEFGHALGLDHTHGKYDVMQQGQLSITSLSSTDKKSYDEAYRTY